jgi:hypothetical protein
MKGCEYESALRNVQALSSRHQSLFPYWFEVTCLKSFVVIR